VSPPRTLSLLALGLLALGCSSTPFQPGPNALKSANEDFEKSLRFQDYSGAASLVTPVRRQAFLAARRKEHDDLEITDMEVIDVQMSGDGLHALVLSRMRWVKLPSVVEVNAEVRAQWDVMGTQWVVSVLQGGPFPELEVAAPH
jgi:hypothetical protein